MLHAGRELRPCHQGKHQELGTTRKHMYLSHQAGVVPGKDGETKSYLFPLQRGEWQTFGVGAPGPGCEDCGQQKKELA